jgi:O-methyltransferase involved in polyketide biosynthesis
VEEGVRGPSRTAVLTAVARALHREEPQPWVMDDYSFACRRNDLPGGLRVFEVDHPATQSWKRRRLAGLGVELPARLVFAPVDFERQTLREGLERAGFDFG